VEALPREATPLVLLPQRLVQCGDLGGRQRAAAAAAAVLLT
jgi:hypothetical protein